jgi:DNA invertase Pin-like site-specific DNA recombinase
MKVRHARNPSSPDNDRFRDITRNVVGTPHDVPEDVPEGLYSRNLISALSIQELMAVIGYARVSTQEQSLDLQTDALTSAGAMRIFTDLGVSGSKASRPGLDAAVEFMREGDVFMVWRLDRAGRSTLNVLHLIASLADRGIGFRSVTEAIDTTSPAGRLLVTLLSALSAMEREITVERTLAGLASARARGRVGGRPRALSDIQVEQVALMFKRGMSAAEIAKDFGVGRATVYRALAS